MITVVAYPNMMDAADRMVQQLPGSPETALRDLLPPDWAPEMSQTVAWVNGCHTASWDAPVEDDANVVFVGGATDPVTIGLVLLGVSLTVAGVAIAQAQEGEQQPAASAEAPEGSSTYGFYGFRNTYDSEGSPLPVVYGQMRHAPPVINQIISSANLNIALSLALRENLYSMYAIGEGPIYGIGDYEGPVASDADLTGLVGEGSAVRGAGLQINRLDATNFNAGIEWRTGELNQDALLGSQGYVDFTDTATTFQFALTPSLGTDGISEADAPSGSFVPGGGNEIIEADETQYVAQNTEGLADSAICQIAFNRGMGDTQAQDGTELPVEKTIRIQYRETDSLGIQFGNWVLLPEYVVSSSIDSQVVLDIPFDFYDPTTFTAATPSGYVYLSENPGNAAGALQYDVALRNSTNPSVILPTSQSWYFSSWSSPYLWDDHAIPQRSFIWAAQSGTQPSGVFVTDYWGRLLSGNGKGIYAGFVRNYGWWDTGPGSDTSVLFLVQTYDNTLAGDIRQTSFMWVVGQESQYEGDAWHHIGLTYSYEARQFFLYKDGQYIQPWGIANMKADRTFVNNLASDSVRPPIQDATKFFFCEQNNTTGSSYSDTVMKLGETMFMDFVPGLEPNWQLLGAPNIGVDLNGVKNYGITAAINDPTMPPVRSAYRFRQQNVNSGTIFYGNEVTDPLSTSESDGAMRQINPNGGSPPYAVHYYPGGPVTASASGTPKRSYWDVEVFVSSPNEATTQFVNEATIDKLTVLNSQEFSYPSCAIASVRILANEQVNNRRPNVSMIVKGRIIRTWRGQLNADGQPDFVYAWTRNPAWVAADLLCNERYGIGAEVGEEGVDWPSFLEWARYCEEGVEDAFGELDVFGVDIEAYGVDGSTPIMTFYIGLTDDSGITQQALPESWIKAAVEGGEYVYRAWVSVITAAGLNADWITVNDVEGGLNDASNRLGILSMDILDATSSGGFHGWYTYARVRVRWNREDASGNLLPPDGYAISDEVYADDVGLTSLATISGVEQRAFCDIIFDEGKETAWQSVLQVFTAGRAMPIKAGKKIVAVIDRPRPTVASFTQANIVPGSLSITYTGAKQVVNSLEGDILDSQANYRKATILVDHPSIQDPAAFDSFRKERVDLRGITRRSHAIRECTYRLNKYHLRRRQVKFTVGPDAVHLLPGDRFRLSHDVPQYGFSGRLRADYGVTNAFPSGGSFYQSWNVQGGTVITSVFTLLFETTHTVPSAFSTSTVAPSQFISLPCQTLQGGLLSALPGTQGDGSEFDTLSEPTTYYGQVVAVANALYPPSPTTAPLDQIVGLSSYQAAFSVYVREESLGSAPMMGVDFYLYRDETGALVEHSNPQLFEWQSGALVAVGSDAALTASVTNAGSGWYRAEVVYTAANDTGATEGDYIQLRVSQYGNDNTSALGNYLWSSVAAGGKGTQFLRHADPLDVEVGSGWTRVNNTAGSNEVENTAVAPPFYTDTAGAYGFVGSLHYEGLTTGTTPPAIKQAITLPTGSTVTSWNGETIVVQGYLKIGAANTRTDTRLVIQVREGAAVDAEGLLTGDGIDATYQWNGSAWSTSTPTRVQASGAVSNQTATVASVEQNSSTTDADWVEWTARFDYTPTSGTLTDITVLAYCTSTGSTTDAREVNLYGLECHGESKSGTGSGIYQKPYSHRRLVYWGAQYEKASGSVSAFSGGSALKLDRDVVLEAGNNYEVLVRSSFEPDSGVDGDAVEVLAVDSSQVPSSGSTTVSANTNLTVETPTKFAPREGDLYSFGKVEQSAEDFLVATITLDPETMQRDIVGVEYNEAIYDDTEFGTQGLTTVSALPSVGEEQEGLARFGTTPSGENASEFTPTFAAQISPEKDDRGGTQHRLTCTWSYPPRARAAARYAILIGLPYKKLIGRDAQFLPPARELGVIAAQDTSAEFLVSGLIEDTAYAVYFQPIGYDGSRHELYSSPQRIVVAGAMLPLSQLTAPAVSTYTRGFDQVYELTPQRGKRLFDVVEARIGGWVLGQPAFLLDPDAKDPDLKRTLVGQASTATGRTGSQLYMRKKTANGQYGQLTIHEGSEQLVDVTYTYSTANEDDWTAPGAISTDLDLDGDILTWNAPSSALTAQYLPSAVDLGAAKRVLVNAFVEGYQIRPETLEDLTFSLGDNIGRRWTLEGPMDNRDDDNSSILIEWRWTSAASFTTETYRRYAPGEVYARHIQFRVTFTRPTADYDMRVSRLVNQVLEIPAFEADDIDGGTF